MGNLLSLNPKIHGLSADAKVHRGFSNSDGTFGIVPVAVSITLNRLFQVHTCPQKAHSLSRGEPRLRNASRCGARCARSGQARLRCRRGPCGAGVRFPAIMTQVAKRARVSSPEFAWIVESVP